MSRFRILSTDYLDVIGDLDGVIGDHDDVIGDHDDVCFIVR